MSTTQWIAGRDAQGVAVETATLAGVRMDLRLEDASPRLEAGWSWQVSWSTIEGSAAVLGAGLHTRAEARRRAEARAARAALPEESDE